MFDKLFINKNIYILRVMHLAFVFQKYLFTKYEFFLNYLKIWDIKKILSQI